MRLAEIEVGQAYAVGPESYPQRVTVLSIERNYTHRIYTGARWDMGGHNSTGTWIKVLREGTARLTVRTEYVKPQQLLRRWADQEAIIQRQQRERDSQREAVEVLAQSVRAAGLGGRVSLSKVGVKVLLTEREAHQLAALLRSHAECPEEASS